MDGILEQRNPIQRYSYQGRSMTGVFRSGDDLVVKNYPFHRLIPGDIIVFTPDKTRKLIVHRVVAQDSDGTVVTLGDYNCDRDPWQNGAAQYQEAPLCLTRIL